MSAKALRQVAIRVEKIGEETFRADCAGIFASRPSEEAAVDAATKRYARCHDVRPVLLARVAQGEWQMSLRESGE